RIGYLYCSRAVHHDHPDRFGGSTGALRFRSIPIARFEETHGTRSDAGKPSEPRPLHVRYTRILWLPPPLPAFIVSWASAISPSSPSRALWGRVGSPPPRMRAPAPLHSGCWQRSFL